jgi:hypothetical protein
MVTANASRRATTPMSVQSGDQEMLDELRVEVADSLPGIDSLPRRSISPFVAAEVFPLVSPQLAAHSDNGDQGVDEPRIEQACPMHLKLI